MRKITKTILAIFIMCICFSFVSLAGREGLVAAGGVKDITWKYYTGEEDVNGYPLYLKNQWREFDKGWCYFKDDGLTSPSSWLEIDGKWYYFNGDSIMLHDTTTPDGYYVGSDGSWDGEDKDVSSNKPKSPDEAVNNAK